MQKRQQQKKQLCENENTDEYIQHRRLCKIFISGTTETEEDLPRLGGTNQDFTLVAYFETH